MHAFLGSPRASPGRETARPPPGADCGISCTRYARGGAMIAFRISVNGTKICTAGIGPGGVLSIVVSRVAGAPAALLEDGHVLISGLDSDRREHSLWPSPTLRVGDEIGIEILEADAVDPAWRRIPCAESYRDALLLHARAALSAFAESVRRDPGGQLATIAQSARDLLSRAATALVSRALGRPGARAERALIVEQNSRRICVAGVPRRGHVMCLITWAGGARKDPPSQSWFSVSGLNSRTDEHLSWGCPALAVGDHVSIRIARSREHDAPSARAPRR
ncbi:hypothetical protein WME99_12725 [Sorangium sp. So ce136]|uniref:hypothetical protein n=1 Tax=Sorangium sp. So ce136 TaxID=3133284 RepID=UPI003F08FCF4